MLTIEENAKRVKDKLEHDIPRLKAVLARMEKASNDDPYATPWHKGLEEGRLLAYQYAARELEIDPEVREDILNRDIDAIIEAGKGMPVLDNTATV